MRVFLIFIMFVLCVSCESHTASISLADYDCKEDVAIVNSNNEVRIIERSEIKEKHTYGNRVCLTFTFGENMYTYELSHCKEGGY